MIAGIAAGICLAATAYTPSLTTRAAWLLAACLIQLRLLANMFDGMVAIEQGRQSPLGELYNEIPDRVSDAFILIGWVTQRAATSCSATWRPVWRSLWPTSELWAA